MTSETAPPDLSQTVPSMTFQITFSDGQISADDMPAWLSDALGLSGFSSLIDSSDSGVDQPDPSPTHHKNRQHRIRKEEEQVDRALAGHEKDLYNIKCSLVATIHHNTIRGKVCIVGEMIDDAGRLCKYPSQRDILRLNLMGQAENLASLKSFLCREEFALRASAKALIEQHNIPLAEQSTSQDSILEELLGNLRDLAIAVRSNWRKAQDREHVQGSKGFSMLLHLNTP
jgi:hypothetical protein